MSSYAGSEKVAYEAFEIPAEKLSAGGSRNSQGATRPVLRHRAKSDKKDTYSGSRLNFHVPDTKISRGS